MADDQKLYVGTGKSLPGKQGYPDRMAISFTAENLRTMLAYAEANNGWCKVVISQRKTPSQSGQTHYGLIDTWKPTPRADAAPAAKSDPAPWEGEQPPARVKDETQEPLPF